MPIVNYREVSSTARVNSSCSIFFKEIDLMFTPFPSRTDHSRDFILPIKYAVMAAHAGLCAAIDSICLVIQCCALHLEGALLQTKLIAMDLMYLAVMALNTAVSFLSFITRTLATMQNGYLLTTDECSYSEIHEERNALIANFG